jgi:hypothetical protein
MSKDIHVKVKDRVTMAPMWKYDNASGEVINITRHYVVVRWDGVNGDWHYTYEQAKKLQLI